MTLQHELAERRREASPDYLEQIAEMSARLQSVGMTAQCRRSGEGAADFALSLPNGQWARLFDILKSGPVVLAFMRGEWCPFCRAEIEALLEAQPELARLGSTLVIVMPERPSAAMASKVDELGTRALILHDPGLGAALLYGLVFFVPDGLKAFYSERHPALARRLEEQSWLLPLPADYVIASDGRIVLSYAEPDFTRRLEPALIIDTLRSLEGSP